MIIHRISLIASLSIVLVVIGCGASSSGSSIKSSTSDSLSRADQQAQSAAIAEIQKHWLKGPEGWTTSVTSGSAYAPDHFLRQYRELAIESVESQDLSESDRLNGFEWVGKVTFKPTVCREAGGQPTYVLDGMAEGQQAYVEKQPGRWSQWVDYTPGPLLLQKEKGVWAFNYDASYLRGRMPGPNDFAAAGVR